MAFPKNLNNILHMLYLHILESGFDIKGKKSKVVDQPIFRIGRAPDNDWILDCPKKLISRHHCIIECINDAYTINDLSKNGVIINNSPAPIGIGNISALNDGDLINLPGVKISVSFSKSPRPAGNDPFLRLLPMRDKHLLSAPAALDPLITPVISRNEKKSNALGDLDDLTLSASPPSPHVDKRPLPFFQPQTPGPSVTLDRRPAEFNSFQSALPQIMTIPEDWYKDDESINSKRLEVPSQPVANKVATPQIELLLRIISQLCEIDQTLSQTYKSNLMFLSDVEKLKNLGPIDLNRAFSNIDTLMDRLKAIITMREKTSEKFSHQTELIAGNDGDKDDILEILRKPS